MKKTIELTVNGEKRIIPQSSVIDFIESINVDPKSTVVELNRKILKKEYWKETVLNQGDELEILNFVGGG